MTRLSIRQRRVVLTCSGAGIAIGTLLLSAALTNWFRYPLSMEGTFVLTPVLVVVSAGVVLHVLAFRTSGRNRVVFYGALVSGALAAATAVVTSQEALGVSLPPLRADDIDRNDDQVIRTVDGMLVTYHLELHNPFSRAAGVYIVGTAGRQPFKVRVPISHIDAYGDALKPSDWILLSPTSDTNIFLASVTVDPSHSYQFVIDVAKGVVISHGGAKTSR